jgi:hypothetical protein
VGHIGVKGLRNAVTGIIWDDSDIPNCRICALANIKRLPFPKSSNTRADRPLFRIHMDICGPFPLGYGGFRYFVLFIDDHSRFIVIYFLKKRSDCLQYFIEYKTAVENYLGVKIAVLRIDNAPEFIHGAFEVFCKENGIIYEKTVPDASQQNGVAERHNQTVETMIRAMLLDGDLSHFFWPLAAQASVHIKNRVPHSALKDPTTTPFEQWFKRKPDLSHLRPFGCLVTSRKTNSDDLCKLDPRGEEGRFVGYARDAKGYLIWFPASRAIRVRRDVKFHNVPTPALPTTEKLWLDIPFELEPRFDSEGHFPTRLAIEPTPATERTLANEPTPAIERTLANEPTLALERTLANEPTSALERTSANEPIPAVEPISATEPTLAIEPNLASERMTYVKHNLTYPILMISQRH